MDIPVPICIKKFLKYNKKQYQFCQKRRNSVFLYFAEYFEANKIDFTFDHLKYKLNHLNPTTTNHL